MFNLWVNFLRFRAAWQSAGMLASHREVQPVIKLRAFGLVDDAMMLKDIEWLNPSVTGYLENALIFNSKSSVSISR